MADFSVSSETKHKITPLHKVVTLSAGGKLADDADLIAYAQKTVPAGYEAKVMVNISIISVTPV